MHLSLLRKWLWSSVMGQGQNLWLRRKGCDSETEELICPQCYVFLMLKEWSMVGGKNEKSWCKSVNSCKLKMNLLVFRQGARWSCHCCWDSSSRKRKVCFLGNVKEPWVIFAVSFPPGNRQWEQDSQTEISESIFQNLPCCPKCLPPKKVSSEKTLMNILTFNKSRFWFIAV